MLQDEQGKAIKVFKGQVYRKEFAPAKFRPSILLLASFVALVCYSILAINDLSLVPILAILFGAMFFILLANFRQEMKGNREIVVPEHGLAVRNPSLTKLGFDGKSLPREDIASIEVLEFPSDPRANKLRGWRSDGSPAILLLHLRNGRTVSTGTRYRDDVLELARLISGRWGVPLTEPRHRL